jgi:hypothetical protein
MYCSAMLKNTGSEISFNERIQKRQQQRPSAISLSNKHTLIFIGTFQNQ